MAHEISKEKVVAYLMDEMGETERVAFEAALKADSNSHELLAQFRAAADIATEAFRQIAPEDLTLSETEQEGILRKARNGESELVANKEPIPRPYFRPMRVLLVAASVAVVALVAAPPLFRARESARGSSVPDAKRQQEVIDAVRKLTGEQGPMTFEEAERKLLRTMKAPPAGSAPAPEPSGGGEPGQMYASGYINGGNRTEPKTGYGHLLSPGEGELEGETHSGLQNVMVGGSLQVRGNYSYIPVVAEAQAQKRTRLNVKADFTPRVDAYIELDGPAQTTLSYSTEGNEAYSEIKENAFLAAAQEPLSTFSIDVDTASYSNVRRYINKGELPPKDAVRIEELVNYFPYDYAPPQNAEDPFAAHIELAACPWKPKHRLARIGLKGYEVAEAERRPANLVFLFDVSGSMDDPKKLPLVKQAMQMLVERLSAKDRVAIVVYASSTGLFLPSTSGDKKDEILDAIARLSAGGSTNGAGGIQLAYDTAEDMFIKDGTNRVILATDGDFNVGITNRDELVKLIEDKAKTGVFLNVLGFGMGNLKDATLEQLADKGNGTYAYIDTFSEARKVFSEQLSGTLTTIAKDVKIQVEFNPAKVQAYRLIGYESRVLAAQDFNDDTKDAGEIGAGHTVTALYELVPPGEDIDLPNVDPLKYQQQQTPAEGTGTDEWFTLKIRYKQPDGDDSKLLTFPAKDTGGDFDAASPDFKFASAVAAFGMLLRESQYKGNADYRDVIDWAESGFGKDESGYRKEFVQLVREAKRIAS